MFENSTIPYTIVKQISNEGDDQCIWDISKIDEKTLMIKIKNISLRQEPREIVDLTLSISTLQSYAPKSALLCLPDYGVEYHLDLNRTIRTFLQVAYQYTYVLELNFRNCLHEFDNNYMYELVCKLPGSSVDRAGINFFHFLESRKTNMIKTNRRVSVISKNFENLRNVYFCIRRHNEKKFYENSGKISTIIPKLRTIGCDVILQAKDDRIPTHKLILSQNSDVFDKMFTHKMKEEQNGVVDMLDFEAKVVLKMLDYLYTGKLEDLGDMIEPLFKLAHMYQFHELYLRCEEYYMFNVKPDNANIVEILELAKLYDLKTLEKCANNFIANHEKELIQVSTYQQHLIQCIKQENVISILLLAEKFSIENVKISALDFIKRNYNSMVDNEEFMDLFELNPKLMKEVYIFAMRKKI